MAQHILSIGMSHSTLVILDDSLWGEWAAQDAALAILCDTDGQAVTYSQLAERVGDRYAQQATPRRWREQYATVRQAVARLAAEVASARLDVLVVGDDQLELFSLGNMPALAIFYGDKITSGLWTSRFAMDAHREFATTPGFARELLASLIYQGFDVAGVGEIPQADESIGLGHAYGAIVTQIMGEQPIPLVPICVNTYFPPNQPTPSRCFDLGLALHQAIESSPADLRIGVVASGGLSHFVTDERLDRQVFAALRAGSEEQQCAIPPILLNAGSSEIRNWIAVAAASKHLKLIWDEYIPVYRTPAGTGCGLGFACWA